MAYDPQEPMQKTGETFGTFQEKAKGKVNDMREKVDEYYHQGLEKAGEAKKQLERYVQDRPMQSILIASCIALGAGFLIASLVRR